MVDKLWPGIAKQLDANKVPIRYGAYGNGLPRLLCRLGIHREITFETEVGESYMNFKLCARCGKLLFELNMPVSDEEETDD